MRAPRLLGGFLLTLRSIGAAYPAAQEVHPTGRESLEDLDVLRGAVTSAHGGLTRYTTTATLQRAFADARRAAGQGGTLALFRAAELYIAAIRNGHTAVMLPPGLKDSLLAREPILPLGVVVRGDRVRVLRDFVSAGDSLAGAALLAINGIPVKDLLSRLRALVSADGFGASGRSAILSGPSFPERLLVDAGIHAPFRLVVEGPRGVRRTVTTPGLDAGAFFTAWRRRFPGDPEIRSERPPTQFRWLDERRIAMLTIPGWGSSEADAKRRNLRRLFPVVFDSLRQAGTEALIVDLRQNGGGEDEPAQILYSYLAQGPYRWYDSLVVRDTSVRTGARVVDADPIPPELVTRRRHGRFEMTGHPNAGRHEPAAGRFAGGVFLLVDGGTFSTSAEFAAIAKARRRATIVGEETSGGMCGNTSGFEPTIELPHSGIRVRIPLVAYYLAVPRGEWCRFGVRPDVLVEPTVTARLEGRDLTLDRALGLARGALRDRPRPARD